MVVERQVDTAVASPRLLFLVTEDWYFCSHRLALARAARDRGFDVVVATRVARHAHVIETEGFRLVPIVLRRRGMSPWGEAQALAELVGVYRRVRPDLVHHVALKPVVYGSLAARLAKVPRVVNAIAGLGFVFSSQSLRARVLRPLVKAGYRLAFSGACTRVIVQNEDDAQAASALGANPQQVVLIPGSGVDLQQFKPCPEPPGVPVVTMVSRMLRDKGVVELVQAARYLRDDGVDVKVRLVGPPDPENPASLPAADLEAWVEEGVVQWCAGSDDIPAVWAASHVAVLPSYREGLPKSLLEAAACGKPMVATNVPGCRDVVVHGETGLLVPPRDARALATAIARLAGDQELRARLGQRARDRVAAFAEPVVAARTLALYDELLCVCEPA